ncbi:hypothetical protein TYRP_004412 [Tyrophagus putrescentiae]|nr:hypothetical protein TYRP_004412 [Tyrophagus putrescentiae]
MNINQLPDLILRTIFSKLPLRDLLRINLVCSHWKCLQPAVTCGVKKVVILIGDEAINLLNEFRFETPHFDELEGESKVPKLSLDSFEVLDFDWLDRSSSKFLIELLPKITNAQIAVRNVQPTTSIGEKSWGIKSVALEQMIELLTQWEKSLKSLKICLNFTDYYQQECLERDMPRLLKCLNSLQAIQNLALNLQNCFFYESTKSPLDMPFLAKLETFYLSMQDSNELIYDSLIKYALPNTNLREIGLNNIYDTDISHSFFTNVNNLKFYQRIYQLPCLNFSEPSEAMRIFCERYCNLKRISITIRNLPSIYKMTRHLRPLKSLVYLDIDVSFDEEHGLVNDPDAELEMMRAVPVLPPVKILNVYAPLHKHTDLYEIQWHGSLEINEVLDENNDIINPQPENEVHENEGQRAEEEIDLEENLNLDLLFGDENEHTEEEEDADEDQEEVTRQKCLRLSIQPWRFCDKLRKVYTGDNDEPNILHELNLRSPFLAKPMPTVRSKATTPNAVPNMNASVH